MGFFSRYIQIFVGSAYDFMSDHNDKCGVLRITETLDFSGEDFKRRLSLKTIRPVIYTCITFLQFSKFVLSKVLLPSGKAAIYPKTMEREDE